MSLETQAWICPICHDDHLTLDRCTQLRVEVSAPPPLEFHPNQGSSPSSRLALAWFQVLQDLAPGTFITVDNPGHTLLVAARSCLGTRVRKSMPGYTITCYRTADNGRIAMAILPRSSGGTP